MDFAKIYFPNNFNDFSEGNPAMMFLEMAAYVGDILSFYQNTQLQENFLLLAQEKENLYNMAYSLGYRPKATNVASTRLDIFQLVPSDPTNSYAPDMDYALRVKEASGFRTVGGPEFLTTTDCDFNVGSLAPLFSTSSKTVSWAK